MKIILVDKDHDESRAIVLKGWVRAALTLCFLGLPVILGYVGYQLSSGRVLEHHNNKATQAWDDRLEAQQEEVRKAREEAASQLQTLTRRIASLHARLMRLDALGERLTEVADIDSSEFDFGKPLAMGDPATGEDVIAVAAGVVTYADRRHGYGKGYETRYGHSKDLLFNVGDVVKKGQVIALSGNTGRSTGPHVHFEVHKNGRVVDPASYIHSTSR